MCVYVCNPSGSREEERIPSGTVPNEADENGDRGGSVLCEVLRSLFLLDPTALEYVRESPFLSMVHKR